MRTRILSFVHLARRMLTSLPNLLWAMIGYPTRCSRITLIRFSKRVNSIATPLARTLMVVRLLRRLANRMRG